MIQRILVWDIPTRVFHWLLVLSFAGAYLTAESERYRDIHVVLGYTLLGLIAFRLLWGFFGTRYAQFRSFLFKPDEIVAYALSLFKGKPAHYIGHNPLGSLAIWLLLGLGILTGATGVMLFQDIGGEALVVSQFTLLGDCRKGRRPGFDKAADPESALALYNEFVAMLSACGVPTRTGRFQAHMLFSIENDGPVTLILDTEARQ